MHLCTSYCIDAMQFSCVSTFYCLWNDASSFCEEVLSGAVPISAHSGLASIQQVGGCLSEVDRIRTSSDDCLLAKQSFTLLTNVMHAELDISSVSPLSQCATLQFMKYSNIV